jgi:hypothetical protein
MQMHSRNDPKDLDLKEEISLDKNSLIKLDIVELQKLIFSGYVISFPEMKQPLTTANAFNKSLTLGIAKSNLQAVRSV